MKIESKIAYDLGTTIDGLNENLAGAVENIQELLGKLYEYKSKEVLSEEFDLSWLLDEYIRKVELMNNNLIDFVNDQEDLGESLQSLLYNYKQAYEMNKMATYTVPITQKFSYDGKHTIKEKKEEKKNDNLANKPTFGIHPIPNPKRRGRKSNK